MLALLTTFLLDVVALPILALFPDFNKELLTPADGILPTDTLIELTADLLAVEAVVDVEHEVDKEEEESFGMGGNDATLMAVGALGRILDKVSVELLDVDTEGVEDPD